MAEAALDEHRLMAAVATLLPGDAGWPAAAELALNAEVRAFLGRDPAHAGAVARLLALLPDDFSQASAALRESALATAERAEPAAFQLLLTAAYAAYYTDPRVLTAIARNTGIEARAPQPLGYRMPPIAPERLAQLGARANR